MQSQNTSPDFWLWKASIGMKKGESSLEKDKNGNDPTAFGYNIIVMVFKLINQFLGLEYHSSVKLCCRHLIPVVLCHPVTETLTEITSPVRKKRGSWSQSSLCFIFMYFKNFYLWHHHDLTKELLYSVPVQKASTCTELELSMDLSALSFIIIVPTDPLNLTVWWQQPLECNPMWEMRLPSFRKPMCPAQSHVDQKWQYWDLTQVTSSKPTVLPLCRKHTWPHVISCDYCIVSFRK